MRLQKFMASAGVASRRRCEELIAAGLVTVNGRPVTAPGTKVDPLADEVRVAGRKIELPQEKLYYALHKPRGYVTTMHDERGRRSVAGLVAGIKGRVFPVGRLDCDSEGLLLVTNDGELAHALTHPRHRVPKTYVVRVAGIPAPQELKELARGVVLEDGPTAPARVRLLSTRGSTSTLEITIHEGRNRQVRRMCQHIGYPVLRLVRTAIGNLSLGSLKPGKYRRLTAGEVRDLRKLAGLPPVCRHGKHNEPVPV